jgi:hypothetical protein
LIASHYFSKASKAIYTEALREFRERGMLMAAPRSHCKVVCMQFADGARLVVEGSPNLRTNGNREQFMLVNDPGLHDWLSAWVDDLLDKYEGKEEETKR